MALPSFKVRSWPAGSSVMLTLALALVCAGLGAGCRVIQSVAEVPGQTVRAVTPGGRDNNVMDPVEVQQKLLRFADEFATQMIGGIDRLRRGTNAIAPVEAANWKIGIVTEACSIASGPNALANLLDMTVFVTAVRTAVENHWQPNVFGESGRPMLEMCRNSETNIWGLVAGVLKHEQQAELRLAIAAWHQQHPTPENVLGARAVGFAMEAARSKKAATHAPGSVFGLLGLDPLAGLDPATREIALTRMFAERALFVTQWMPTLLRWQIELMSLHSLAIPEVQQMVTNSTQLAASVDRVARAAEQLPKQVSIEREEILKALQSQEQGLATLAGEIRQTLTAGGQMSTSLNTTLTTFDVLMKRFGVGETNMTKSASTNSEPFRILDYGEVATRLEATARQLTELVRSVDQTMGSTNLAKLSTEAAPVILSAQSAGKDVVDYAFRKIIWLIVIACACVLLTVWLGRLFRARPANSK